MKEDRALSFYVARISRLSGCLQFMHTAEVDEDHDDSDEEDIKTNLFKAAEQEVLRLKPILIFLFGSLLKLLVLIDNDSLL